VNNPYRVPLPPLDEQNFRDAKFVKLFIGNDKISNVLDIGIENHLISILKRHFVGIKIDNTSKDIDFDVDKLSGSYDTVFCFEVIEHLFNPLHLLIEIKKVLKDSGYLYLSVPKKKPLFLQGTCHFHEFYKKDLVNLVEWAGFKIIRESIIMERPLWRYFLGIRLFLRLFFERRFYLKLEKIK